MRNKLGMGLMVLGMVLIVSAGLLVIHNTRQSQAAAARSAAVLEAFQAYRQEQAQEQEQAVIQEVLPMPEEMETLLLEMPVVSIDGAEYVGTLSIPALGLELPVISQWSYPSLQTAPCRYSGDIYQEDLVLCGHSYNTHFGRLSALVPGDKVIFTCMDGAVHTFEVALSEILSPREVEAMTAGEFPLTLFTCTLDSQSRVTIRCIEAAY